MGGCTVSEKSSWAEEMYHRQSERLRLSAEESGRLWRENPLPPSDKPKIRLQFSSHGLGDVVAACHAMALYQSRGYDVAIQIEPNKRWAWEAAGIPIHHGDDLPIHPYHYPSDFFDLSKPDHTHSKIAHLFEVAELPKLGTKAAVWQAICDIEIDATHAVSSRAMDDAAKFLEGLPKPIILLHSKGTNWQEKKSIPDGVAFQLIRELLDTGGSVVTLDWDGRAPTLGHERVRGIKPTWHHISLEEFGALCILSDLLIGVDSGPFHLAGWFDIPTLYVSREIPPVRCCLPSPMATYLVPAKDHEHWLARGPEWRFLEFQGSEATAMDIACVASAILNGGQDRVTVTAKDLVPMDDSCEVDAASIPGRYTYKRVGHDERSMDLLPDGTIGDGAAGCEQAWKIEETPVGRVLTIVGDGGRPTCQLRPRHDGVLCGRWLRHERMPIELVRQDEAAAEEPLPPMAMSHALRNRERDAAATTDDESLRRHWTDQEPITDPLSRRPAITVVMNWDAGYDGIAQIVVRNREAYASRHGYPIRKSRHAGSWGKLDALLDAWNETEWLWWLDTDACITNPSQRLEDFLSDQHDVVITCDRNGISAGAMLIRTVPTVRAIFEDVLNRREEFDWPNGLWEQNGLMWQFWKIKDRIKILPQSAMNSYHQRDRGSHTWEPGDFVLHCAGLTNDKRMEVLSESVASTGIYHRVDTKHQPSRIEQEERAANVTAIAPHSVPGRYIYRRVGYDERAIELLADGKIGDGAGGCERAWKLQQRPMGQVLTIFGEHCGPTCHLEHRGDGAFHGCWLHNERMPIELIPCNNAAEVSETVTWNDLVPMVTESPCKSQGHPSDTRPDAPTEFHVVIATLNCFDLADLCIEAILRSTWLPRRIYVIDNSGGKFPGHPSKRVQVFTPTHNLGAGGSANFILPAIHPAPAVLVNDDIEVAPDTLEAMLKCPDLVVTADGVSAFTCILIREEAWKRVGIFDPVFWPAYCEDADWQHRAALLGIGITCPRSGGYIENGPSATQQRMSEEERAKLNRHQDTCKEYYVRKWGGTPRVEVFTVPFNGAPQS